jgi:hypothetical protein
LKNWQISSSKKQALLTSSSGENYASSKASASTWQAVLDESSGDIYYWDQLTGETSWEIPKPNILSDTIRPLALPDADYVSWPLSEWSQTAGNPIASIDIGANTSTLSSTQSSGAWQELNANLSSFRHGMGTQESVPRAPSDDQVSRVFIYHSNHCAKMMIGAAYNLTTYTPERMCHT